MAHFNVNWSSSPGPVLESLVAELRRLGRWRRDGPKLRCLNKHWREQVDIRITRVRPIRPERDCERSLESLSNMTNLTCLRLDPFLTRQSPFEDRESLISRFKCLSKLTKLTDLDLHGGFFEKVDLTPEECCQTIRLCPFECFQNVTSVVFNDVPFREGQSLSFLESSPIRELRFIGIRCCQYLNYPWFNALKSLEFVTDIVSPDFTREISCLVSLQSLSISSKIYGALVLYNAESLSHLTSLVSLHLPDSEVGLPLWLTTLPNLASLSLRISDFESNEEEIWTLMESVPSLTSLALSNRIIKVQSFLNYSVAAQNLRSLDILVGPNMKDVYLSLFNPLTRLGIDFGDKKTGILPLVDLTSLQELSLRGNCHVKSIFHKIHASCMTNLIALELDWCVQDHVMEGITHVQSLKKLCLLCCTQLSMNAISELRKLPNLSELCLVGLKDGGEISSSPLREALVETLDLLCLAYTQHSYFSTYWIQKSFPHVKITDSLEKFWNHSCIGQKVMRPKLYSRSRAISKDSRI